MDHKELISEALRRSADEIPYYVGSELARLFPDRTVLYCGSEHLDLMTYAKAGLCAIVYETTVFNQSEARWKGRKKGIEEQPENAWLNVMWEGHLLDVILISWWGGYSRYRRHWIVADTRETAEGLLTALCNWSSEVHSEVLVFQDGWWERDEDLFEALKMSSFDRLVLEGALKQEIFDDLTRFFDSREVYDKYSIPWKRGILLTGPPGNGKTCTIKALVNKLGRPCLYVKSLKSEDETDDVNIRSVFLRARRSAPCIVVLEDLDSLIADASKSAFLNELDGFPSNTGMAVIGTTNHPERLDPAIADRPSRFDGKFYFGLPDYSLRVEFISLWNADLEAEARLSAGDITAIAMQTEGFSFAYLRELCTSSLVRWMADQQDQEMNKVMLSMLSILKRQLESRSPAVESGAAAKA
jgi:hypothetical protein